MRVRKLLLASAVATAMASPSVFAGPPSDTLGFGYTGAGGTLTTADSTYCAPSSGFTCSGQPISGDGFLQVQLTDGAGNTYFQTIIDDPGSDFTSVSFVTTGAADGGIAAEQTLGNLTATGTAQTGLYDKTNIYTGSFRDTADTTEADITIDQRVFNQGEAYADSLFTADFTFTKNLGNGGENTITLAQVILEEYADAHTGTHAYADGSTVYEFADKFTLTQNQDTATGDILAETIDIDSGVRLNDVVHDAGNNLLVTSGGVKVDANNTPTSADALFIYNKRRGDAIAAASSATFDNGQTVDWVAGDTAAQTLLTQTVTGAGDFAFASINDLVDTDGTAAADNADLASDFSLATADATSLFSVATPDPF